MSPPGSFARPHLRCRRACGHRGPRLPEHISLGCAYQTRFRSMLSMRATRGPGIGFLITDIKTFNLPRPTAAPRKAPHRVAEDRMALLRLPAASRPRWVMPTIVSTIVLLVAASAVAWQARRVANAP